MSWGLPVPLHPLLSSYAVFTLQSIRRICCFVKYLYYLINYFYELKIYSLLRRGYVSIARFLSSGSQNRPVHPREKLAGVLVAAGYSGRLVDSSTLICRVTLHACQTSLACRSSHGPHSTISTSHGQKLPSCASADWSSKIAARPSVPTAPSAKSQYARQFTNRSLRRSRLKRSLRERPVLRS